MSELIFISNARLSFPHIADPQRMVVEATGKERISYNCELILAPTDPGFAHFIKVVNEMALAKWTDTAAQTMAMIHSDRRKRCFGKGEEKVNGKTFKPYDGYEGHVYITAGRDSMPQIIGPDGSAIDPTNTMACQAIARKMYGGAYINAAIKPWLQDNKHGRAVRCDLVAVQFFADGAAFGEGATDASSMFGATPGAAAQPALGGGHAPGFASLAMPWDTPAAPAGLPSFLQ